MKSKKQSSHHGEKATRYVNTNVLVSNVMLMMAKWLYEDRDVVHRFTFLPFYSEARLPCGGLPVCSIYVQVIFRRVLPNQAN